MLLLSPYRSSSGVVDEIVVRMNSADSPCGTIRSYTRVEKVDGICISCRCAEQKKKKNGCE